MKYSCRYFRGNYLEGSFSELILRYSHYTVDLLPFMENHPYHKIVINIASLSEEDFNKSIEIFNAAKGMKNGFRVMVSTERVDDYVPVLIDNEIPFFFEEGCSSWADLVSKVRCGVKEVYVFDELGLDIERVSSYCKAHDVEIRVLPNLLQSTAFDKSYLATDLQSFFIRPEDREMYEPYVDTFEFFYTDLTKQPTFLKIYMRGTWRDSLQTLIYGFDEDIYSNALPPMWNHRRLSCQQRCLQDKCHLCMGAASFSRAMIDKGYEIKKGKEERYDGENEAPNQFKSSEEFYDFITKGIAESTSENVGGSWLSEGPAD